MVEKNMHIFTNNRVPGYVTLISVIIVGAIMTTIVISLLANSTSYSKNSLIAIEAAQARALADACTEEALQKIRDELFFVGTFDLIFADGTCTAAVSDFDAGSKHIESSGQAGNSVAKVMAEMTQLSPQIILNFWQEVADF